MAALRKFTFDRVFDAPPPEAERSEADFKAAAAQPEAAPAAAPEAPPAPTFSEEDMAQARAEAYAQGRDAGLKEMSESLEREMRDTLAAVESALRELMWSQSAIETRGTEDAVRVALAAVRRLFPALASRDPLAEVEQVAAQAMAMVQGEATLNIYVNDRLVGPVSERIRALASAAGFQDRIKIHALASIGPGDVRVEWGKSGISRDRASLEKAIDDVFARALPEPAAADQPPPAPADAQAALAAPSPSDNSEGHHG